MAKRPPAKRTLLQVAMAITVYLHRFERDKSINVVPTYVSRATGRTEEKGIKPYYYASARASGSRVFVTYVTFQGSSSLTRARAEAYLAWLDAGNVGTHYEAEAAALNKANNG